jgi:hypothetical protein
MIKFLLLCWLALLSGVKSDNNGCISFSVGQGTGCAWMCNYCSTNLGTNNYYFTDDVCTYQSGFGCVGNPVAGKQYTCCSVTVNDEL